MAKGEYERGDKAKFYRYTIVKEGEFYRVARCLPDKVLPGENMFGNLSRWHSGA